MQKALMRERERTLKAEINMQSRSNVDRKALGAKEKQWKGDDKMKLNEVEETEVEMGQSAGDNKKSFRGVKYIQIVQDGIRK